MRLVLLAFVVFLSLLPAARAQQDADDKYIAIHTIIQQAEQLADSGEPKQALASLTDAQTQLQQFQKVYPDWNPNIISYRLDDLGNRITAIKAKIAAQAPPPPRIDTSPGLSSSQAAQLTAEEANLRAQLQSMQGENVTLQAKLREALSSLPATVDVSQLSQAQEQIRSLMKENDLLKATATLEKTTNQLSALRQQLADAIDKYTTEQTRAQRLIDENSTLQRDIKRVGQDSTTVDLLHSENDRLKTQITALQSAANDATAAGELAAKLTAAKTQISSLQTTVKVVTLEKGALEGKVKQLSAELQQLRAANFEGRIHDLTDERDELAKQLAGAGGGSHKNVDSQMTALAEEMQTLRARLAVDEAKTIPYSVEELALFRESPPQPAVARHSVHELPSGAAELVASAQRHFSNHEYDAAEADYQKILERDQNNGLVLANLATIELQEGKLAEAEKHITTALVESPDDAYNLSTLGYLKFREEKYDDALDVLSRAAKVDPNNPEIQNYLGVTLSHKGLRVQAEKALRKAIQIDPNYAPANNNLAVVYLNQNPPLPLLARWHYQKAITAGQPRNPDLERLLADRGAAVAPAQ